MMIQGMENTFYLFILYVGKCVKVRRQLERVSSFLLFVSPGTQTRVCGLAGKNVCLVSPLVALMNM